MLLPITLGQATWHYHFYLLHIWGFAREKKSLWYLFRKDIELSQYIVYYTQYIILVSFVQFLQPHNVVILTWNEIDEKHQIFPPELFLFSVPHSFIYFSAFVVSWYHISPFPRLKGPYYTNNIDFISESACQRRVDTAVNFVDFWVLERSAVVIQKLCEVDEFYAM